jgi:radical SAM protein with 4Fe4S-binding SPASM domain
MMRLHGIAYLEERLSRFRHKPIYGQLELTYRCDYHCRHCYCIGSENIGRELTTAEVKNILDEIHAAGCLRLTLTGGDPLIRPDFKEIYAYARQKGFIITILTNGYRLNRQLIDYFAKYPPLSIDITVNSLKPRIYAKITGFSSNALARVLSNILYASRKGLAMIIKTNCFKENLKEIAKIKRWAHNLPGKSKENLYNFRYDTIIFPRLNGDTSPCRLRLNQKELNEVHRLDPDIKKEHQEYLKKDLPSGKIPRQFLYFCTAFKSQFIINPFGRLKICENTDKFGVDLCKVSFKQGFYKEFPKLTRERFKTNSICRKCRIRETCYSCPATAFLETGDEEKPVKYFCRLAHNAVKAARSKRRKQ